MLCRNFSIIDFFSFWFSLTSFIILRYCLPAFCWYTDLSWQGKQEDSLGSIKPQLKKKDAKTSILNKQELIKTSSGYILF